MAQRKMYCALQRTKSDTEKVSEERKESFSRKIQEQRNLSTSLEDCGVSSHAWRNSDRGCAVLTFLTVGSDGHLRIVALPLQFPDHTIQLGSAAQVNMDRLHLICPPSISSYKADQQIVRKGPPAVGTCSTTSFTARNLPGSNVRGQSRTKALANKATKLNELSSNSSHHSSFICSNSSGLSSNGSKANSASDIFVDSSQLDKAVKRNSRKKARKKGKQSRKLSCDSGSTELEILSDSAHGSLTSETCGNNGLDGNGPVSSVAPEVSLPDFMLDGNSFDGSSSGIISETPKTCSSYADEVDVSETIAPSAVQNYTGGHPVCSSDHLYQAKDFSIFGGGVEDTHCTQTSCYDDTYSKGLSDAHDSLVLDSVSIASDSDDDIHSSHYVEQSEKESCRISTYQPTGFNSSKGYLSHLSSLNGVVDTYDPIERKKRGSLGSSCSDIQVVVPGKRGKQNRIVARSSSVHRFGSVGRFHDRTGKENNHSVWQKVQRNDANGCNGELNKASPICSQFDVTLKEAPLLKRTCNVDEGLLSKSEDKKNLKDKASSKLKRKNSPALKQEYGYSRKDSDADKASSNGFAKISPQVSNQKALVSVSSSHSEINLHEATCLSNRVGYITSESVESTQVYPDVLEPLGSVCSAVSSIDNHHIGNHGFSLAKSCDSLDQSNLLGVQSPVYLPHLLVNEVGPVQIETSVAEYRKENLGNRSILPRWIPIGMKDRGFTIAARSDCSSLEHSDVPDAELENTVDGKMSSNSQNHFSSSTAEVMCVGQNSGDVSSALEDERHTQKLGNQGASMFNGHDNKHVAADFLTVKSTDQHPLETNSYKIGRAANNACRIQLASEAIQMATGGPIAEFERLLDLSSPVVSESSSLTSCQTCLRDQVGAGLLCRHEIPNIPLGCLWQWYEKHGSYGLEIRAEDFENSKRLGVDRFSFRAYFVPFLSAVQLFRNCRSYPVDSSKNIHSSEVPEAYEASVTSENSSTVHHLPIFSVLFPQPRTNNASGPQLGNQVCGSEQSPVSVKDDAPVQSVDMTCSSDFELLFEYFESEQPQQRRPLYEKIRELVRDDGPSHCKAYGDSTKLESINLHELHPCSWYSVAWYPIYRIPDGDFRAAFLTYHSLGHLVRRSAKFDVSNRDACIVSPVVGLQSYNAQGECWFQLRQSVQSQTVENPGLNPFVILKERLRTLEETASLMARAVVNKGNLTSVNRHPDYEFFLSRRR